MRAGLAKRAPDYSWSSAAAHVAGRDDPLVSVDPLLEMAGKGRWEQFLGEEVMDDEWHRLRRHERPLGGEGFLAHLESLLERALRQLQKRGPNGPWKHRRKD